MHAKYRCLYSNFQTKKIIVNVCLHIEDNSPFFFSMGNLEKTDPNEILILNFIQKL